MCLFIGWLISFTTTLLLLVCFLSEERFLKHTFGFSCFGLSIGEAAAGAETAGVERVIGGTDVYVGVARTGGVVRSGGVVSDGGVILGAVTVGAFLATVLGVTREGGATKAGVKREGGRARRGGGGRVTPRAFRTSRTHEKNASFTPWPVSAEASK